MDFFKSPKSRCFIERTQQSILITISSYKNIFLVLWLSLFLCFWFLFFSGLGVGWGAFAILSSSGIKGQQTLFPIVLFVLLSIMQIFHGYLGIFAVSRLLWVLFGVEYFDVDRSKLVISKEVFGWRKSKTYILVKVKDLEIIAKTNLFSRRRLQRRHYESISFEYEGKMYRFGYSLNPRDSKEVVTTIQEFLSLPS